MNEPNIINIISGVLLIFMGAFSIIVSEKNIENFYKVVSNFFKRFKK